MPIKFRLVTAAPLLLLALILPAPPASLTAAASRPPDTPPIGASRIGCSIPSIRVNRVRSVI